MDRSHPLDGHPLLDVGSKWRREGKLFMDHDVDLVAGSLGRRDAQGLPSNSPIAPAFAASARMMAAYDGARALGILWGQGEVHHVADYALLRVMFEGAGSAWWITSGTSREERITRAFRVVLDELEQAKNREERTIKQLSPGEEREARGRALSNIERLTGELRDQMNDAGIPAPEKAKISIPVILNAANSATTDAVEYAFATAWSMTSSVAHGALTSVLQLADRSQESHMVMSSPDSVLSFTDPVGALLELARQSWNRYATDSL